MGDPIDELADWQLSQQPREVWRQCPLCRSSWLDPDGTVNTCDCGYTGIVPATCERPSR